MIIQSKETKSQPSLIDLLGGGGKNGSAKSNDIFSKLLNSMGMQSKNTQTNESTTLDPKVVKTNDFKAIIDPKSSSVKGSETKSAAFKELQALLEGGEEKDSALISKELLNTLSQDQVRPLIQKAKEYLKQEISQKAPEYQNEKTEMPKTLLGLVQLAKKLGLEPESITLSTLVQENEEKAPIVSDLLSKPLLETKLLASLPLTAPVEKDIGSFEAITQLLSEMKGKDTKNLKASESQKELSSSEDQKEANPLKSLLQSLTSRTDTAEAAPVAVTDKAVENKGSQSSNAPHKTESLITLLQGEIETIPLKHEGGSAKGDVDSIKPLQTLKADSLEVKSKEAQQGLRHFASDLKEAVQDYKPPFTRLTMKLNPEKLGEVEVTLVQRGNNVHVNIQSNNTASVAFLAHNATELKAQLAHQGITNATMNFMSGGENPQQNSAQQQQQEHQQNRYKAYQSFEELELNEEQLSALEIIIPHYA